MELNLLVAFLALGVAIVSIAMRFWESPPEVKRRLAQLELDLAQSVETVSRWMKRENVRRARDEKESPANDTVELPRSAFVDKKATLRARAQARGFLR